MSVMALNSLIAGHGSLHETDVVKFRKALQQYAIARDDVLAVTADTRLCRLVDDIDQDVLAEIWFEYATTQGVIKPLVKDLPDLTITPLGVMARFMDADKNAKLMLCQNEELTVFCKDSFLNACYAHNNTIEHNRLAKHMHQIVKKHHLDDLELAVLYGADIDEHMELLNYQEPTRHTLLRLMGDSLIPSKCCAFDLKHKRFLRTHEPYGNGLPAPKVGRLMTYDDFKEYLLELYRDDNIRIVYCDSHRDLPPDIFKYDEFL